MTKKEKVRKTRRKKDFKKEKELPSKKEILTEKKQEISKEVLEELLEQEVSQNDQISHILANPWKDVSLDKREIEPVSNLEDLPEVKKEEDEEKEGIEYNLFKDLDEGKYQTINAETKFKKNNLGEEEKILEEHKMLYEKMQKLSDEQRIEQEDHMKYVKPEDTMNENYLAKRKFF